MKVLALFSLRAPELGGVGAQCEGLGWVPRQGVGCWSAPTAPWPSLWANGGYALGFLCVSGSVINVIMQDMRHDFISFRFFRRITHCFHCPWGVLQLRRSSHLPFQWGHFLEMQKESPSVLSGRDDKQTSRGENKGVWHYSISRKQSNIRLCLSGVGHIFSENGERWLDRCEENTWAQALAAARLWWDLKFLGPVKTDVSHSWILALNESLISKNPNRVASRPGGCWSFWFFCQFISLCVVWFFLFKLKTCFEFV